MAQSYEDKEIKYTHGHKCTPNGSGDYTFVCPEHGEKPGFIPFMARSLLKGKCICGKSIEVIEKQKY